MYQLRLLVFIMILNSCNQNGSNLSVVPSVSSSSESASSASSNSTINQTAQPNTQPNEKVPSSWPNVVQIGTTSIDQALGGDILPNHDLVVVGRTEGALGLNQHFGMADGFIAFINDAGGVDWITQLGTTAVDQFLDVIYHPEGLIFAAGLSTGDFGGQVNQQFADGILVALTVDGTVLWQKLLDLGTVNRIIPTSQGIAVVGAMDDEGDSQAYVAQYTLNGERTWLQTFNSPAYDAATTVTFHDDILYVSGFTFGSIVESTHQEFMNMYVSAVSVDGEILWLREYGSDQDDSPIRIAHTSDGLVLTGYTNGLLGDVAYGENDIALIKLDFNGEIQWIKQMGTTGSEAAYALTIQNDDSIILAGRIDGASWDERSNAQGDAFVLRVSATGELIQVYQSHIDGIDEWVDIFLSDDQLNLVGYRSNSDNIPDIVIDRWSSWKEE